MSKLINKIALFAVLLSFNVPAYALEPGDLAPHFSLPRYDGQMVNLTDFKGKTVVLEWFNNGCPFVMKHYRSGHMQRLQSDFKTKGVVWLTINSTNKDHKDFLTPEKAVSFINDQKAKDAIFLVDANGSVGKSYDAKTTPTMYVIGPDGKIAYQGAIDNDSDTDADPFKSENYVSAALISKLDNKEPKVQKTASYGCSVKYAG